MSMQRRRLPCRCEKPNLMDALHFSGPEFRRQMRAKVGEGLREARTRHGIGLREMGRLAGVDASNLSKLESGAVWSDTIVERVVGVLKGRTLERGSEG